MFRLVAVIALLVHAQLSFCGAGWEKSTLISDSSSTETVGNYLPDIAASEDGMESLVVYYRNSKVYAVYQDDISLPGGTETLIGYGTSPRVATDGAGIFTVVWEDATQLDLKYRCYNSTNSTWSAVGTIDTNGPSLSNPSGNYDHADFRPRIAATTDGYWIITWQRTCISDEDEYGYDNDIFFSYANTTAGTAPSFSASMPLIPADDEVNYDFVGSVDCATTGEVRMLWYRFRGCDGLSSGTMCTTESTIRVTTGTRPMSTLGDGYVVYDCAANAVSVDPLGLVVRNVFGNWYAAWAGVHSSTGGDNEIYFSDFSNVSIITDNPTSDSSNDTLPAIGNGWRKKIMVAWQSADSAYQIYYKELSPSGWSAAKILPESIGENLWIALTAIDNEDIALATWAGTEAVVYAGFNIFFSIYY